MDSFNLTNNFLIAMPTLEDPYFSKALIYVCEHTRNGALGIIVNRPLELNLASLLEKVNITFERQVLAHWLEKGGEIRGKLNGIGFAQTLNMEVDNAQHLVVRDISLQGSRLALPGTESQQNMPAEIKQQLDELAEEWHRQHLSFNDQQKCLFIHSDWLAQIEASLQDVAAQIKQAQQC